MKNPKHAKPRLNVLCSNNNQRALMSTHGAPDHLAKHSNDDSLLEPPLKIIAMAKLKPATGSVRGDNQAHSELSATYTLLNINEKQLYSTACGTPMNLTISETLRTTLISLGVRQETIGAFDHHSSIELNFKNINPIMITIKNDMAWMWSEIRNLNSFNINLHAESLVDLLQHALPGILTGQAVLGKANDGYEIKALLAEECVGSPDTLRLALDEFYRLMTSIQNTFNH
ncbi:hypothetical protein I5S62_23765 [Pseudomonas putida]|uniref:InvB/SpaK family type III secretion system chaperone n=1 Tax=Pseudomonas putida TaxID=303 RepID=UPI000A3E8F64|nr:hypothetical protein [Pseudomonas putida]MBH3392126.1 hypothetical protein [Pseudomonas putida]MDQ2484676.1 hypothetical protein [Pseudomonas putida]